MKLAANLLKISLLLTLLPASASAITITISAPTDLSTEITVTVTGTAFIMADDFMGTNDAYFGNIGDFITNGTGPDGEKFNLSSGITAGGETATRIRLDDDGGANDDDLTLYFDGFSQSTGTYTF